MGRSSFRTAETEIFYLSSAPSVDQFSAMKQLLKPGARTVSYGMAEASFKFHSLIQDGLSAQPDTHVYSVVGRAVSPSMHGRGVWGRVLEKSGSRTTDHLGFPNVRFAKQLWLAVSFLRAALVWRWRTRHAESRVLIVDAAYVTALPGVLRVLSGGGISRIGIFADVYGFMADVSDAGRGGSGRLHSLTRKAVRRLMTRVYSGLDGFVLLTEQMNDVVNPSGRPHLVMEGLVDADMAQQPNRQVDKRPNPTVVYAGALRREYGLGDLVEGFRRVADPQARLVLFGGGDFVSELSTISSLDPRITYGGSLSISEVVREEQRAWLLVNPRPVHAEFTKYSFPSKNMEYMASGTPVLTTRLPGMPADYYPFVLTIDEDGPAAITEALEQALSMDITHLCELGDRSREFVLNEKNHLVQSGRILTFAKECTRV